MALLPEGDLVEGVSFVDRGLGAGPAGGAVLNRLEAEAEAARAEPIEVACPEVGRTWPLEISPPPQSPGPAFKESPDLLRRVPM